MIPSSNFLVYLTGTILIFNLAMLILVVLLYQRTTKDRPLSLFTSKKTRGKMAIAMPEEQGGFMAPEPQREPNTPHQAVRQNRKGEYLAYCPGKDPDRVAQGLEERQFENGRT